MSTETLDEQKRVIAEAIAPTWERRRADLGEVPTPAREWMVRELPPQEGETVGELCAGGTGSASLIYLARWGASHT